MRGWMLGVLASIVITSAHAQNVSPLPPDAGEAPAKPAVCPKPLEKANPGWYGETYSYNARWEQLVPDPPTQAFQIRGFPLRFSELMGANSWSNMERLRMRGRFQACTEGTYEFTLFIQAQVNPRGFSYEGLHCMGSVKSGTQKIAAITEPVKRYTSYIAIPWGTTRGFPGSVSLNSGWVPLEIELYCAGMLDLVTKENYNVPLPEALLNTTILLRVRAPGDNAPRDLRPGEVVFLPRGE